MREGKVNKVWQQSLQKASLFWGSKEHAEEHDFKNEPMPSNPHQKHVSMENGRRTELICDDKKVYGAFKCEMMLFCLTCACLSWNNRKPLIKWWPLNECNGKLSQLGWEVFICFKQTPISRTQTSNSHTAELGASFLNVYDIQTRRCVFCQKGKSHRYAKEAILFYEYYLLLKALYMI